MGTKYGNEGCSGDGLWVVGFDDLEGREVLLALSEFPVEALCVVLVYIIP